MKHYKTSVYCQRLVSCLVAYMHPFNFDGFSVEFTASEEFVEKIKSIDNVIAKIDFEVI